MRNFFARLVTALIPFRKVRRKVRSYLNSYIINTAKPYLLERCRGRKLLIYGTGREAQKLTRRLSSIHINVEHYLSGKPSDAVLENRSVKSYLDVVYEDPDSIFIIIADEKEGYGSARQKFLQLGLAEDIDFTWYHGVYIYESKYYFDVTLSHSRVSGQIEGFELFGELDNPNALKIVALGGSTTESSWKFMKGWARCLTDRFRENGVSVIMYCGGISGYTSAQELLKLIRDALPLKPDIVLSYSGFNDLFHSPECAKIRKKLYPQRERRPFITDFQVKFMSGVLSKYLRTKRIVYYGLQNNKTAAEFWLDNTRMMHAIAEEFNILFLSFLQPFFYIGGYESTDSQKIIFRRWFNAEAPTDWSKKVIEFAINGAKEMADSIKNIDYITDLTHIFSGCTNIYRDHCHVYEHGNEIIADNIYKKLVQYLDGGRVK